MLKILQWNALILILTWYFNTNAIEQLPLHRIVQLCHRLVSELSWQIKTMPFFLSWMKSRKSFFVGIISGWTKWQELEFFFFIERGWSHETGSPFLVKDNVWGFTPRPQNHKFITSGMTGPFSGEKKRSDSRLQ